MEETKDIFNHIDKQIKTISLLIKQDNRAFQKNKEIFEDFEDNYKKEVEELDENTQWDRFTIAFYGETNAGKSTLIEALRIHFKEPTKLEQQKKFKTACKEKMSIEDELNEFHLKSIELQQKINLELENANFWGKIKIFLGFSQNKKQMRKIQKNIKKLKKQNYTLDEILKETCDGSNTNAKTDFTTEVTPYHFKINNELVQILDIPGIEGKEDYLKDKIKEATQQAHCVLILVRDCKIEEGTLNTIKQGLRDQTEIYVVFNKSATNPHSLKPKKEDGQMQTMIEKVKNDLPKSYKGSKSIYALSAFLSQASCLLETSDNTITQEKQNKFLSKYKECGDDTLRQKQQLSKESFFDDFTAFIEGILTNTKDKIRCNIFNKVGELLGKFGKVVDTLSNGFKEFCENLEKNTSYLESNINKVCNSGRNALQSIVDRKLKTFINKIREEIHKKIETDIKDDEFKNYTESTLENELPNLEEELKQAMEGQHKKLLEDLEDEFKDFERISKNTLATFKQNLLQDLGLEFGSIDSGISWTGLAGAGVGGALLIAGMATVNPLVIALGAISVIISTLKSIYKFFSSSYKKAEQRKSLAKALDKLEQDIKEKYCESIESYIEEVQKQCEEKLQAIKDSNKQCNDNAETLRQIQGQISTLQKNVLANIEVKN